MMHYMRPCIQHIPWVGFGWRGLGWYGKEVVNTDTKTVFCTANNNQSFGRREQSKLTRLGYHYLRKR